MSNIQVTIPKGAAAWPEDGGAEKDTTRGQKFRERERVTTPPRGAEYRRSRVKRSRRRLDVEREIGQRDDGESENNPGVGIFRSDIVARRKYLICKFASVSSDWLISLGNLNTACMEIPTDLIIRLAVGVFTDFLISLHNLEITNEDIKACAAAAFWVSIKFASSRNTLPNASFISHVTHVRKPALIHMEVKVMESISWDVYSIARKLELIE